MTAAPVAKPTALAIADDGSAVAISPDGTAVHLAPHRASAALRAIEDEQQPRWVWWDKSTARRLAELGVRAARCWDLGAVHRLLHGGWRSEPARVWATVNGLDPNAVPTVAPVDLFNHDVDRGDPDQPIEPGGHLRPEWTDGEWQHSPARIERWARLVLDVHRWQVEQLALRTERPSIRATALSESAADMLCAELELDGLPFDRAIAEQIVADFVGPRPSDAGEAQAELDRRDHEVLRHLPAGTHFDLRSPDQVKSLLRRVGIEVPDTRAWRLEGLRDAHPIVEPLLEWRRAERILTTFGYSWIDENVRAGPDGHDRLRGSWSGSDGAAGRMTATAGLHNMPAELRPAIAADPDHMFVRADLGQIEPRILAAVSGDDRLAHASQDDDMYAPVAERLRVERDIAKVAVLGAMYGQTTGKGAEALRGLEREYPVAMGYLTDASVAAQGSRDLRTYGGRLVRMSSTNANEVSDRDARSRAAARGRYGRNAMIQGAAAEFFKMWAVLMRARSRHLGATIVLCLHDELVVHTPLDVAEQTAEILDASLQETAARWRPSTNGHPVRFVSDTSIISDWSQAK